MFYKQYYKNIGEKEIQKEIQEDGYRPVKFTNKAGDVYSEHNHKETKILVFLKGSMKVKVGIKNYDCKKGDKLIIAGYTNHSAIVGTTGCTFFWSEKL